MVKQFHLVGLAGVGMSALAQVLLAQGCRVSGSDRYLDAGGSLDVLEKLRAAGVQLRAQDGSGVTEGLTGLVVSSAIEPDNPDLDTSQTWVDAIRAHGIHNNMFIAAINRVGCEDADTNLPVQYDHMNFYGRSFLSNTWGEVLVEGSRDKDEVIVCEVDFDEIKKSRDILQFHRDRRVDSYAEILQKQCTD